MKTFIKAEKKTNLQTNIWKNQAFNLGYKLMHKSEQKFITNIDYLLSPKSILNGQKKCRKVSLFIINES